MIATGRPPASAGGQRCSSRSGEARELLGGGLQTLGLRRGVVGAGGWWEREDGPVGGVQQAWGDVAEHESTERRVPACADDDHVSVDLIRYLSEALRDVAGGVLGDVQGGIDSVADELGGLRLDFGVDLGFVEERVLAGHAPADELFGHVGDVQVAVVLTRELGCVAQRAVGVFRAVGGAQNRGEHGCLSLSRFLWCLQLDCDTGVRQWGPDPIVDRDRLLDPGSSSRTPLDTSEGIHLMNRAIESSSLPLRSEGASSAAARSSVCCLVVDDHPAIRVGLRELLACDPGFVVVDAVASAEVAITVAKRCRVDVAIVDYQLGGRSGLWLSRKLKRLADPPAVLVYSAFSDYLLGAACVVAEADGLVSKAALGSELGERVREVARGGTCLPMVAPLLGEILRRRLDAREQAIFGLMSARVAVEEIGRTLGLTHGELEALLGGMLRKLERIDRVRGE
jgi:two-component system response regulator DevR